MKFGKRMESRGAKGRPKTALHNPLRYITARAESVSWASQYRLMRERFRMAKSLYRRDLKAHYGCVNAIEFSNDGLFIVSGKCCIIIRFCYCCNRHSHLKAFD